MYDYDYMSQQYEPSAADEVLNEFKDKMKNVLLQQVKDDIEQIKSENIRLKEENDKYKQREKDISSKERDLKYKEENLKREIEKEFYESSIGNILKEYIENCELWFANQEFYQKEKCNLCNDKRELVAKFPNGKIMTTKCDCNELLTRFVPALSTIDLIKFHKHSSSYISDKRFYLSRSYSPNRENNYYKDEYSEFKITDIVYEFNDDIKLIHKNRKYDERLGFKSKEECQKYCNWLNDQK